MKPRTVIKLIILVILLSFYAFFLFHEIDLTTADLGRHIKNGEMILTKNFDVLYKNFYSYTNPDYPFVNHHWLSGVVFFLLFKFFGGIKAVHFLYIILSLFTFYFFFYIARKESGFKIAALGSIFLIPLIAARSEIRPEAFSYFFAGLFFLILWKFKKGEISYRWLFILPLLEVFWVNFHIYFILGLFLIGIFFLESLYFKNLRKNSSILGGILALSSCATFLNPFGAKGALFPFRIFENYGYKIAENQSVYFLINWGYKNPNLLLFIIVFIVLSLSFVFVFFKNRKSFSYLYFLIFLVFGIMGWMAIRNFTIFAFFSLPIFSYNTKIIFKILEKSKRNLTNSILLLFLSFCLIFHLINHYPLLKICSKTMGLGLMPGNSLSAEFFIKNNIKGPIFNNYDIGSYLIFYLFPKERPFVDNRPEAFSSSFFKDIYIPAQEDESAWKKIDSIYNFNVIFFNRNDITPWAQPFLIRRLDDSEWAPVFVDLYTIIFLKRNSQNENLIEKYQIPKKFFRVTK